MKHKQIFALTLALVALATWVVFTQPTKRGLDLAGGTRIVLEARTDKLPPKEKWDQEKQRAIVRIIRNRVDILGVSEPLIQPRGEKQIIVELPDIKNRQEAIDRLQSTARLEFRHFRSVKDKRHPGAKYKMDIESDEEGNDVHIFEDKQGNNVDPATVIAESPIILMGDDLKPTAGAQRNATTFEIYVSMEFDKEGRKKFADFTRRNVGEYLAMILDDKILSAPYIKSAILDGTAIIEGGFASVEEAQRLAEFLNAGALPVPLDVVQTHTVEATLGQDSVNRSVQAGIWGLIAVLAFMVGYYLLPGLIADFALGIYALLTFAVFKAIPVTLTLPGIAAYVLSIGMAVDANILIFERLKEELRSGKTLRAAIDAGFKRAFTSIFDSNMCTAITCVILWWFGTGPIKGFALVLLLGVAISMFTAITVTRSILHLLVNTGLADNEMLLGVRRQWVAGQRGRSVNVVRHMWVYFIISGLLLAPGLYFWLGAGTLKPGIDFTGGSMTQMEFKQPVARAAVAGVLSSAGLEGSMVQKSTENPRVVFVRTKDVTDQKLREVHGQLEKRFGEFEMPQVEKIGPTISRELKTNAIKAVLLAAAAIVLYLTARFAIGGIAYGFRFGVCAIIALLHDIGITVGAFAIFGKFLNWEIDSLFVTALLTILGYSVHDTIVIFDRVRENLRHRSKDESFDGIVNKSILQSFARSINTSLTLILTLVALLVFGAPVIQRFVTALLIGVALGTYSSMFNASQILVLWQRLGEPRPTRKAVEDIPPAATSVEQLEAVTQDTGDSSGEVEAEGVTGRRADAGTGGSRSKLKKRKRRF